MKKRILSMVIAVIMVIGIMPVTSFAAESGECGENASYTLDDNGVLTVSGSGAIAAYAFHNNQNIKTVIIEDGITSIGDSAFEFCQGLANLTIPDSVISIGDSAFWYCEGITSLIIPASVKTIGNEAFKDLPYLESVKILGNVDSIGEWAFENAIDLSTFEYWGTTPPEGDGPLFTYQIEISVNKDYTGEDFFGMYCEKSLGAGSSEAETDPTTVEQLQEAINKGGTVKLGGDIDLNGTVLTFPDNTPVIIDLNGKTLSNSKASSYILQLTEDDNVTITGDGAMTKGSGWYFFRNESGYLKIEGGTYDKAGYDLVYTDGTAVTEITGGTFVLDNIIARQSDDSTAKITEGTFTVSTIATGIWDRGTTVTGGTYNINPADVVPNTHEVISNADSTFSVREKPSKFAVTVVNGEGGGDYEKGATVSIKADAPAEGKQFAGWVSDDGVTFANEAEAETTFVMPEKAVTVTATYVDCTHNESTADDGNCTTAYVCSVCGKTLEEAKADHSFTDRKSEEQATPADCINPATYYVQCDNCDAVSNSVTVEYGDNLGHDWKVEYEWAEDGSSCIAKHICGRDDSHTETANAVITSEQTKAPTTTAKGETTYTAKFNAEWAETQTKTVADIQMLNKANLSVGSGGKAKVDNKTPATGETVTITAEPNIGYEIKNITVTDENGKRIKITDNGDGTYSFIQPNGDVRIKVSFREKEKIVIDIGEKEDETNPNTGAPVF